MKVNKIVLFTTLFFLSSCSQYSNKEKLYCIQIFDRNNLSETISMEEKLKNYSKINFESPQPYKKVLRIFKNQNKNSNCSILTSYHENGQLDKYLEIKDARAFGVYKEFYPNGNIKILSNVINGTPDFNFLSDWQFDKISKVFDENGNLISEFLYDKGVLNGPSKYYYSNGKIKKKVFYKNNELHDSEMEYDENSNILKITKYENGVKHGTSKGFFSENNLSFIEDYQNGLLIKAQYFNKSKVRISKIVNADGFKAVLKKNKLFSLIEYQNGKEEGLVQIFDDDEYLINEYHQKNGIKNGEEIEYYPKDLSLNKYSKEKLVRLSMFWDNGKISGSVKTFYKNGKIESQKEYFDNRKHGSHFAWYEDGSIMFIEEYENDILLKGKYFKSSDGKVISEILNGNGTATIYDSKGRFLKKINYKNGQIN